MWEGREFWRLPLTELCPPNVYIEAQTLSVIVLGDEIFDK